MYAVCVRPFLSHHIYDGNFNYALKDFSVLFVTNNNEYDGLDYDKSCVHALVSLQMFGDVTCRYRPQDITWCQELLYHEPAAATAVYKNTDTPDFLAYGKDPSLVLWYKSAAILIRIPKWSNYRQKLIAISTGNYCVKAKAVETDEEDGMVKDFKDIIQDYDDIIQEETQQLLDQIKELLDNDHISKV